MPDVKKIINNGNLIAHIAPLIDTPEARDLATAAKTYRAILLDFHIEVDTDEFDGCDEAKLLIRWINTGIEVDSAELMTRWTAEIWSAIADLAAGKLPA